MKPLLAALSLFAVTSHAVPVSASEAWGDFNRSLMIGAVTTAQNYREVDTAGLTVNGTLDTEKGWIGGAALQARWQGKIGEFPLWAQAGYQQSTGQTDYEGYLQSGNTLQPYKAKTGNKLNDLHFRLGIPLATPEAVLQVIPFVEIASRRWRRNLVGYGETYDFHSAGAGLLAQWRFAAKWVAEAEASVGQQYDSTMKAPALGFSASLGNEKQQQYGLAARYFVMDSLSIGAHWRYLNYDNKASAVVNGMQEPPSRTRQNQLGISAAWHY